MKYSWLITGGCGFIGTSLIKKLLQEEFLNIRIIDNLSIGSKNNIKEISNFHEIKIDQIKDRPKGVELIVGDVKDNDLAIAACKGCDVIVHLAANTGVGPSVENPRLDMLVNVMGTFNYLEAARIQKVSRFIFASSGAPVGEVKPPIHEELAPHPVSPYGASKLSGEGYCSAYKKTFGIDTIALRFGNVYGPGSIHKSSVISKFINQALKGEELQIYGDGRQTRDFIFIDDLIDAILLSTAKPNIGGEIFQIASSRETTINEMINILLTALKSHGLNDIKVKNISKRIGDVMRNYSDTSKANNLLNWQPKVKLHEGISKTILYFIDKL